MASMLARLTPEAMESRSVGMQGQRTLTY
jgi:hypothetical protein